MRIALLLLVVFVACSCAKVHQCKTKGQVKTCVSLWTVTLSQGKMLKAMQEVAEEGPDAEPDCVVPLAGNDAAGR